MGRIYEQTIDRFDGGFSNDLRSKDFSKFATVKHFDAFSYAHKLVPGYKTEAVTSENKALFITKFLYATNNYGTDTGFRLYGLGVPSGDTTNGKIQIYQYNIDSDIDSVWATTTNGASSSGARNTTVFFYYKGYIYVWKAGTTLTRFDTDGGDVFNDSYQSITYTNLAQPVHHQADDIAYFFTDNKVHTLNNTTWASTVLTLPNNVKITSACEYGNFLAIGVTTLGSRKHSTVYLWDRDSSLATITDKIDFGHGELLYLAVLNNRLIGVVNYYVDNLMGLGKKRFYIRQASGSSFVNMNFVDADTAWVVEKTSFVEDNRLYFPLKAVYKGDTNYGIWAVDEYGKLAIEFIEEEATSYQGIFKIGQVWFTGHSGDGSVNRTDNNFAYSSTLASVYETLKDPSYSRRKKKKLKGVTVTHEPLLDTGGQVVIKHRIDSETSWTTITTNTTDNSVETHAIKESDDSTFPDHHDMQIRVESTGGAVITGIDYWTEELDKQIYD